MSSYTELNDAVICPREELGPGQYYLLDIAVPIINYMKVPEPVRMEAVSEGEELSEYEMVDVELSAIIPALTERNYTTRLDRMVERALDEGVDQVVYQLKKIGLHEPDKEYENTKLQHLHADAVMQLGQDVAGVLREYGFYDKDGILKVEYVGLLSNGVVALRTAEHMLL